MSWGGLLRRCLAFIGGPQRNLWPLDSYRRRWKEWGRGLAVSVREPDRLSRPSTPASSTLRESPSGSNIQVLSVHMTLPATTVRQLIELAKDPKSRLNYGSAGSGTTGHLVAELLKKRAGIPLTHIPFKG